MLARSTSSHVFSLLPCFGPQDSAAITREDVKKEAYGLLDQGRSRSTVKAALAPLCEMFIDLRPALYSGLPGKSRFDTLRLSHYGKQQFGKGGESDA